MNSFAKAASTGSSFNPVFNEVLTGTFRPSSSKSVGKVDPKAKRENLERSKNFPTQTVSSMDYDGETVLTTPSDRLAAGTYTLPSGEKVELKGGFGYPAQTGKVWAASKMSKATPLVGQINRQIKERGYALVAPIIMADASHKSNYTYFSVAMKLINQAADKKKLSNKAFLDQVKNAGKKAGVDLSDVNAKTVKENTDILLDKFSVESGDFERRKDFITELLGNTTPGGKNNAKLNGVVTSDQLAAMLADPILDGMPRGAIVSLIKVTKPVVARKTSIEEDGFLFHESYPAVIESEEGGIEMILIDDAQLAMEAIPVAETTNGKIISLAAREGDKNKYATDLGLSNIPGVTRGTLVLSSMPGPDGEQPVDVISDMLDSSIKTRSSKFNEDKKGFDESEISKLKASKYKKEEIEAIVNNGTYAFLTAENPQAVSTQEDNESRMSRAKQWLWDKGYLPAEIYGMYGMKENSFFVPYMTMEDAIAFRQEFDQQSVAHSDGLVYSDYVNPRVREDNNFDVDYTDPKLDYYSVVKDFNGNVFGLSTSYDDSKEKEISLSEALKNAKTKEEAIVELLERGGYHKLNEDGEGNFIFYHYGNRIKGPISPRFFKKNKYTSDVRYTKSVAFYYTDRMERETMVNGDAYVVKIPKNKVYPFNQDPRGYYEKAKENYVKYLYPKEDLSQGLGKYNFPWDAQAAFIGDLARQDGYQIMVAAWGGQGFSTRGESQIDLTPDEAMTKTFRKTKGKEVIEGKPIKVISPTGISTRRSKASQAAQEAVNEFGTDGAVKPTTVQKMKDVAMSQLFLTDDQQLVRSFKETKESMISRMSLKIRNMSEDLNNLLGKDNELRLAVNNMLTNPSSESFDVIEANPKGEQIFDLITDMRAFIDPISKDLAISPTYSGIPEPIRQKIYENLGSYMRTTYRFWKDKNYTITKAMRKEAVAHQFDRLAAYRYEKLISEGMTQEAAEVFINQNRDALVRDAEKSIDDYIANIEKQRNKPSFSIPGLTSAGQIKIPSDQLKGKKDIPDFIQDLLGVEKDPVARFVDTATALVNMKYKGEMVHKILNSLGSDLIKSADQVTTGEIDSKEFLKVNDKYSPLDGMYVHKDVFEVINNENIYAAESLAGKLYMNTLKMSRKTKVLYNLPTWRKNITGGWQIMMANGVLNPRVIQDLTKRGAFLAGKEMSDVTELMDRMAEFGLIGADVNANIVNGVNAIYISTVTGDVKLAEKASNYLKSLDSRIAEKYSAIDDYSKMIIFRNKRDTFAKKLYGKPFSELTESQKYKSDAALAEEIKQNTPTFSRLPPIYKKLARLPVGDFMSFKIEAIRSISNVFTSAVSDIKKSQDPKLNSVQRKAYLTDGVAKLMGASGAVSMAYVIPAMLSSMLLGDDDELYQDALNLRANWMDGHNLVVRKVFPDGRISFYDLSMEDTYGDLTNSIFALSNGDLGKFFNSMSDDFGLNMVVTAGTSLLEGQDQYGRDLYESYDPAVVKALKAAGYVGKSVIYPPFLYSAVRDAERAVEDNPDLNLSEEIFSRIASRTFIRDYEVNAGAQFYYATKEYAKGIKEDEQYTQLDGSRRDIRLSDLEKMREEYLSLVNIANYYGNKEMKRSAKSNIKRNLYGEEEAFVLRGKMK
jgi:hypothetical protein